MDAIKGSELVYVNGSPEFEEAEGLKSKSPIDLLGIIGNVIDWFIRLRTMVELTSFAG